MQVAVAPDMSFATHQNKRALPRATTTAFDSWREDPAAPDPVPRPCVGSATASAAVHSALGRETCTAVGRRGRGGGTLKAAVLQLLFPPKQSTNKSAFWALLPPTWIMATRSALHSLSSCRGDSCLGVTCVISSHSKISELTRELVLFHQEPSNFRGRVFDHGCSLRFTPSPRHRR